MDHREFQYWLKDALSQQPEIESVCTFREADLVTGNMGVVVCDKDGDEHQVSILGS